MKRSFVCRSALALTASFYLAVGLTRADEPAKADPPEQSQNDKRWTTQELELQHARLRLADQVHQFADFDARITLLNANGLGIDVAVPDAALRAQLSLAEREGVTVTQVPDDSSGAKAGLKVHDVIIQVGGHGVGEIADLNQALEAVDGKSVKLKLWRAGKQTEVEATPKKPEIVQLKLSNLVTAELDNQLVALAEQYRIGVTLSEADDTLRQQLRLAAAEGLVVTEVVAESPAAQAGIQTHDVLTMLNGKRLTTVEAINAQIQEIKETSVELRLLRGGKELTLQIAPRKTQEAAFVNQPLLYWDSKTCRDCHADAGHHAMRWKLHADSAWTDGHHGKLFRRELIANSQSGTAAATAPQQQVEALKSQLAEMQKTLSVLEASLRDSPKAEDNANDKGEEKKD